MPAMDIPSHRHWIPNPSRDNGTEFETGVGTETGRGENLSDSPARRWQEGFEAEKGARHRQGLRIHHPRPARLRQDGLVAV